MTQEDDEIWKVYAKGVKKLGTPEPREKKAKREPPSPPAPPPEIFIPSLPPEPPPKKSPRPPPALASLPVKMERNMSLGEVVIEGKLDLHGQTEKEAHAALLDFIEKQQKTGRRMLLVITGKGRDGTSPLRANLPRWCGVAPLAEKILAVRAAAPHHGGDGAYYVLLKKKERRA